MEDLPTAYVARHGRMRQVALFDAPADPEPLPRGRDVVLRTERGLELGEVLGPATARTRRLLDGPPGGAIVRAATPADLARRAELAARRERAFADADAAIARRGLLMELVDVEAILGDERLVFFYLAEHRVDFRELVKDLARACRTRVEMRQIGVRDEAKLLADYGDCGQPVCCNTHLTRMPPVSMRMAKLQKATLDPARITGRCGRLKCCLRYEFETYLEHERRLPPVGARVETTRGAGRVVGLDLLALRALVESDDRDRRRAVVTADQIVSIEPKRRPPAARPPGRADDPERA